MAGNAQHEQPGLEVIEEPEAPQVVQGPTYPKQQWDQSTVNSGSPYQQTHTPVHAGYGQYPPQAAGYPPSPAPWGSSHTGTGTIPEKSVGPTICGIKRRKFWLIVGPLIAVFIIGLAVGLGAGLGLSHSSSTTAAAARLVLLPRSKRRFALSHPVTHKSIVPLHPLHRRHPVRPPRRP